MRFWAHVSKQEKIARNKNIPFEFPLQRDQGEMGETCFTIICPSQWETGAEELVRGI